MVQKNCRTRSAHSSNKLVEFDFDVPLENTVPKFRNRQQSQWGQHCQRKKTTSKYKGVTWYAQTQKWQSQIQKNSKRHHLGFYVNEKEAALAYDKAALQLFGEYARTNQMIYPEDFKTNI